MCQEKERKVNVLPDRYSPDGRIRQRGRLHGDDDLVHLVSSPSLPLAHHPGPAGHAHHCGLHG